MYLSHNDHPRAKIIVESRNNRLGKALKSKYSNNTSITSEPSLENNKKADSFSEKEKDNTEKFQTEVN